jgi:hypothetical protein
MMNNRLSVVVVDIFSDHWKHAAKDDGLFTHQKDHRKVRNSYNSWGTIDTKKEQ